MAAVPHRRNLDRGEHSRYRTDRVTNKDTRDDGKCPFRKILKLSARNIFVIRIDYED